MIGLAHKNVGLKRAVLGRITFRPVERGQRADHILVCQDGNAARQDLRGYAGLVWRTQPPRKGLFQRRPEGVIIDQPDLPLRPGDVALLNPETATTTVLYSPLYRHNCIMTTERCNSRCIMCPQPPVEEKYSKTPLNRRLIRLMAPGPASLGISGGEPTLLGEDLFGLIGDCKTHLPATDITILTNGRLFRDIQLARRLAACGHCRLRLSVPISGDTDDLHDEICGVAGAFAQTIAGLQNLALYRQQCEIRVVIIKPNAGRLVRIADFIYRNLPFAVHVAFMAMEMTGLARANREKVWIDQWDYRDELLEACRFLHAREMNVSLYNHQLCVIRPELWSLAAQSISDWKNFYQPVCQNCSAKPRCCGFFQSCLDMPCPHISPISA